MTLPAFRATFRGQTRLTPTPDEIEALDADVQAAADGRDKYATALTLLWQAIRAASPGFARLDPVHPVREPKVQRPAIDQDPAGGGEGR